MSITSTERETHQSIPNYTSYGGSGKKYVPSLCVKDIAKILRKTIKTMLPNGAKISITTESRSLNISLTAWEGEVFSEAYKEYLKDCDGKLYFQNWLLDHGYLRENNMFSDGISELLNTIKEMAKTYQQNDSDMMRDYFDCNFYLDVTVSFDLEMSARNDLAKS